MPSGMRAMSKVTIALAALFVLAAVSPAPTTNAELGPAEGITVRHYGAICPLAVDEYTITVGFIRHAIVIALSGGNLLPFPRGETMEVGQFLSRCISPTTGLVTERLCIFESWPDDTIFTIVRDVYENPKCEYQNDD